MLLLLTMLSLGFADSALTLLLSLSLPWPCLGHRNAYGSGHASAATIANTTSGAVRGAFVADGDYVAFRGIPFAEPPVGSLRFEAPRPFVPAAAKTPPDAAVRDATKFGFQCWQFQYQSLWSTAVPEGEQSEDCLTVNVFVPRQRRSADKSALRPMLVWIYGGGFSSGSASGTKLLVHRSRHARAGLRT
jgi:para-nitrobenzyl esterase